MLNKFCIASLFFFNIVSVFGQIGTDWLCRHTDNGETMRMDCGCAKTSDEYQSCCAFDEYMNCMITNSNAEDRFSCLSGESGSNTITSESLIDEDILLEIMAPYDLVPITGYDETSFTDPSESTFDLLISTSDVFPSGGNDNSFNNIGDITNTANERTYCTRLDKPQASYYRVVPKTTTVVGCQGDEIFIRNEEEGTASNTGKSWKSRKMMAFSFKPDTYTLYNVEAWMDSALLVNAFCDIDLFDKCKYNYDDSDSSDQSADDGSRRMRRLLSLL